MNSGNEDNPIQRSFDFLDEIKSESNVANQASHKTIGDEEQEQLCAAILALSTLEGIGFKAICNAYDSSFLQSIVQDVIGISSHPFVTKSKNESLAAFTKNARNEIRERSASLLESLGSAEIRFTTIGHASYPKAFYKLPDPPRWLFVQGSAEILHATSIAAIVGTRNASDEGIELARSVSVVLAKQNIVVLSGLARGIDEAAHQGCMDYYGETIAILGEGILFNRISKNASALRETILDRENVIASEYLPNDPPSERSFLRRNALQVALSRAVFPIEFPKQQSGTGGTILRSKKLGVPVIGIVPREIQSKSMLATRSNFELEHIPIHVMEADLESQIVGILKEILPEHPWYPGPEKRQQRFFSVLTKRVLQASERLELNDSSFDILTAMLKKELRSRS